MQTNRDEDTADRRYVELLSLKTENSTPETRIEFAQLCIKKSLAMSKRERVEMAKFVLTEVTLDCPDPYIVLAEEAETLAERIEFYTQAVSASRRRISRLLSRSRRRRPLRDDPRTVPFVRAMEGLGDALLDAQENERAATVWRELAMLDTPANVDYYARKLAPLLANIARFDELVGLLNKSGDSSTTSPHIMYSRVLCCLVRYGDTEWTRKALSNAMACNQYVPKCLLRSSAMPADVDENYIAGSVEEAWCYVKTGLVGWQKQEDALDWLRRQVESSV